MDMYVCHACTWKLVEAFKWTCTCEMNIIPDKEAGSDDWHDMRTRKERVRCLEAHLSEMLVVNAFEPSKAEPYRKSNRPEPALEER
jgi:hypothetical protein